MCGVFKFHRRLAFFEKAICRPPASGHRMQNLCRKAINSTSVFCLLHITRINKASHLLRWCHGPFDSGTECWPQLVKFSYQEQCCSLRFDFSTPASLICIAWIHDVLSVFVSTVLPQRVKILCSKICTSYIALEYVRFPETLAGEDP